MKRCVATCSDALGRLQQFVQANGFTDTAGEIAFFKTMKPEIESLLFYHNNLLRIGLAKPVGSADLVRRYYEAELGKINGFYDENRFLTTYYRSGDTFLDDKLFVRTAGTVVPGFMPVTHTAGPSALCDGFVANLLANERLAHWLNEAIHTSGELRCAPAPGLRWTDTKSALVEYLYGWHRKGCFGNGQASLKDIADFIESNFGVKLGNYYRTIQELRIKKQRAGHLQELTRVLLEYMDETDLNYKG